MKFRDEEEGFSKIVNLHEGHRDRLRERLIRNSFTEVDDYQVLEYILTLVIKRRDTNELAHTLVKTFGSLAGVFDAEMDDLVTVKGVTPTIAYFLHSIPFIFRNYKISKLKPKATIACPQDIFNYMGQCIFHLPKEEFYLICLDNSNRVIYKRSLGSGGNTQVSLNVKELVAVATKVNAVKVVMLHNHPTGDCLATIEDIETTKRIYMGFALAGIELYDHIIVDSSEQFFSFAHEGILEKFKQDCKSLFSVS